jgi:uncharacterized protein
MMANENTNSQRGLASADEETRQRVASLGGRAVSENREHMAEIGRKGGEKSRSNRDDEDNT